MGGFIVLPRLNNEPVNALEQRCQKSLEVFNKKQLKLDTRLVRDNFIAYRYQKILNNRPCSLEFDNGDFIFYTGAFLYKNNIGTQALKSFYQDHLAQQVEERDIAGNFSLVVFSQNQLYYYGDYCGYYPVYYHEKSLAFSNSLIAIAHLNDSQTIRAHEFYEYLFHGFLIGGQTYLEGVNFFASNHIYKIGKELESIRRIPAYSPVSPTAEFDELVEIIAQDYKRYYETLATAYSGSIASALSGGFDTRHMLASLRQVQVDPYLYVYGKDNDSDVTVAKAIAAGENLKLDHVNKGKTPKRSVEEFSQAVLRDLYFFDAVKSVGIIDDGSDIETRLSRAEHAELQLNGAGGEIYREIWNIGNRSIDLTTFTRMRFDRGDYSFCQDIFDHGPYFSRFNKKIHQILDTKNDPITRSQAEMLFPFLRNHFAQANNAANNQITDSLLPFMETYFVYPSYDLPIEYKYCGRFHSALIRAASPSIAKYMSSYGINFQDPIPTTYSTKRALERQIPFWLRLYVRRKRVRTAPTLPYYFDREYLSSLFNPDDLKLNHFIKFDQLHDPEILSRAYTVEVLINHL